MIERDEQVVKELIELAQVQGWRWVRQNCRTDLRPLVEELIAEEEPEEL